MSNEGNGAQSSTHVSGTTYSDDDDFGSFFDDVVPKLTQLHPHPSAVSILTDQETHSVDTPNTEIYDTQNFTEASRSLMGKHTPKNKSRNTDTALYRFAAFYVNFYNILSPQSVTKMSSSESTPQVRKSLKKQAVSLTNLSLFRLEDGNMAPNDVSVWPDYLFERVNHALVEFVAHIKQGDGSDVMPTTLKNYILGLQRGFKTRYGYDINIASGKVFSNSSNGVFSVIDNKIRSLQGAGKTPRGHNILGEKEILELYMSDSLSKNHPKSLVTRVIFSIALTCAFRLTELHALKMDQTGFTVIDGEEVLRIVGRIGGSEGDSKNWQGGFYDAARKPKDIIIWRREQADGRICVFDDVKLYYSIVSKFRKNHQNFFCAVNYFFKSTDKFFKNSNLGREQISRYVSDACEACNISGSGVRETMTAHGLRGTVISRLFECGHAPSAVALRTGHRSLKSLESYKNLHGALGLRQQLDLFSSTAESLQSAKRAKVDKCDSNELDVVVSVENVTSSKNSPKPETPHPESQAHTPATSNHGPVVNLSNGASNVTINFNYHYSK